MRVIRTRLLPRITTWNAYRRIFLRGRVWTPAIRTILNRHGYDRFRLTGAFPGTCVVRTARLPGNDTVVVKIFPPMVREDLEIERTALAAARSRLPVPRVIARGMIHDRVDWGYLIIDPVAGVAIREKMGRLSHACAMAIARELGATVRKLHRIPVRGLKLPGSDRSRWPDRRRRLVAVAVSRLRLSFLPGALVSAIAERLDRLTRPTGKPVLVHGDITEDHVMLARVGAGWRLSGLIDFADAAVGDPMYELLPVWFGALGRKPSLLRRYLSEYAPGRPITPAWRDRAAAFVLVHQFGVESVVGALKRDRVNLRGLDWNALRDWAFPPTLERK